MLLYELTQYPVTGAKTAQQGPLVIPEDMQEVEENALIVEGPADDIIPELQNIGLNDYRKDSGITVSVYVPRQDRKKTIEILLDRLDGAEYSKAGSSSVGQVLYKGAKIQVRPAGSSGGESAGLKNEAHLVETITRMISEVGPLNITFVGDNGKSITANNVTQAISAGADTKGRKKSDVNLLSNGKAIPLSLKKGNAEFWESADTIWGNKADALVDQLLKDKKITLTPYPDGNVRSTDQKPFVKINPSVAMQATAEETLDVVFGSDILQGYGGVVKETFVDENYTLKGNELSITADLVITTAEDIPEKAKPWWLVRNGGVGRPRPKHKYPGLRIQAVYGSRIGPTVIKIPKDYIS